MLTFSSVKLFDTIKLLQKLISLYSSLFNEYVNIRDSESNDYSIIYEMNTISIAKIWKHLGNMAKMNLAWPLWIWPRFHFT